MLTTAAYAEHIGKSQRTVQRYVEPGSHTVVPGAQMIDGQWWFPSDARPVKAASYDVVPVPPPTGTSYDVAAGVAIPPGLWKLEDVAAFYGTTVGRVRFMGKHPRSPFIVDRFGPPDESGHATWRVWVL
jgi:hypothetical protein